MVAKYYLAKDRGKLDYGWLTSYYSFNFETLAEFEVIRFGQLRLLNNDIIQGGTGFASHPHDNMEIISIPLSGGLVHKDNLGNSHQIIPGDVQVMTAGTGIIHSEKNLFTGEPTNFLQIWVFPDKKELEPRYEQQSFDSNNRLNEWDLMIAPQGQAPLYINQSAYFSRINLEKSKKTQYNMYQKGHGVLFYMINGEVKINEEEFSTGDAVGYADSVHIPVIGIQNADILAIEIPMY